MEDSKYSWWLELQHGGMIISPAILKEFIPEGFAQPSRKSFIDLRDQFLKFKSASENPSKTRKSGKPIYNWLDFLFENFLDLNQALWKKEVNISSEYSFKNLIGENIKPNRIFFRNTEDTKPSLALFIDENPKMGMGKSRKRYGKILEYLRNKKFRLAVFINGYQVRLCYVGLDHDSWVEWNISNWFEGVEFLPQLYGFYTLLGKYGCYRPDTTVFPLYDAIESSRTRQGELSTVLGEQVRESLEVLLRDFGKTKKQYPDITSVVRKNPDGTSISEEAELSAIFQASVRVVMRLVVVLFAEARHLLPRSNDVYHSNYGIEGLYEQLNKAKSHATSDFMEMNTSGWYRLLSLFHLIYNGSPLSNLQVREYRGQLFEPGDVTSFDPVKRALTLFEDPRFELTNASVYDILKKLKFGKVKIKVGRSIIPVKAPVDFRELRTEYIGMIYEGILDYGLKSAREPMLLLNTGIQPILPLSVLEALSDAQIKELFEKMKDSKSESKIEGAEEDGEDFDEDISEEEEVPEEEVIDETEVISEISEEKNQSALSERIQSWAEKAVIALQWVKKPKRDADDYLFNIQLKQRAKTIWKEVFDSEEYYISRWGGTRKGSGTFYTRPQLAVPTVIRTLEPLCYTSEKPEILTALSDETVNFVQERLEKYEIKHLYPRRPEEILNLKICDPACGSGSFLVSATNYITETLFNSLVLHADLLNTGTAIRKTLPFGKIQDKPDFSDNLPCSPDDELFELRVKAKLKRYIVENCIYGVDLNQTAVELAKLSLWIETMDKDLPFEFLDHKIKTGNSLVGTWLDTFHEYPLAAWLREGGDKTHSNGIHYVKEGWNKAIKNRFDIVIKPKMAEHINIRIGQQTLAFGGDIQDVQVLHNDLLQQYNLLHTADVSIFGLEEKQRHFEELLKSESYCKIKQRMDTWCALWFWPGDKINDAPDPIEFYKLSATQNNMVNAIAERHHFFHWEIEFPDVFNATHSGFDAIIGNPPWEISKPNSKEFFSDLDPIYRTYGKEEALQHQKRLFIGNDSIEYKWLLYTSYFKSMSNFVKNAAFPFGDPNENDDNRISITRGISNLNHHRNWRSKRKHRCFASKYHPYRHQGSADLNTYKLFLEYSHAILNQKGRLGMIVPSGIYSDKGTQGLRLLFLNHCSWEWLFSFENKNKIFDIHRSFKFNPIIVQKGGETKEVKTAFMQHLMINWEEGINAFSYKSSQLLKFNPKSISFLEFISKEDIQLVDQIYDTSVLLGLDMDWNIKYKTEFHITNDSKYFKKRNILEDQGFYTDDFDRLFSDHNVFWAGLYEGRLIDIYDFSSKYWISGSGRSSKWGSSDFENKVFAPQFFADSTVLSSLRDNLDYSSSRIEFMRITSSTNKRTVKASLINYVVGEANTPLLLTSNQNKFYLLSILNSFVFDYILRFRCVGLTLDYHFMEAAPIPNLNYFNMKMIPIIANLAIPHRRFSLDWILIKNLIPDIYNSNLFSHWALQEHERLRLKCILDAIIAEIYQLSFDDYQNILNDSQSNPKGFWRIDKEKPKELRQTTLTILAFKRLKEIGLDAFINEDWQFPENIQIQLGPRFLDWQLQGTPEDSWKECEKNARKILGEEGFEKFIENIGTSQNTENQMQVEEPKWSYKKSKDQLNLFE